MRSPLAAGHRDGWRPDKERNHQDSHACASTPVGRNDHLPGEQQVSIGGHPDPPLHGPLAYLRRETEHRCGGKKEPGDEIRGGVELSRIEMLPAREPTEAGNKHQPENAADSWSASVPVYPRRCEGRGSSTSEAVALARTGPIFARRRAGKVKVPPPASALAAPPSTDAPSRIRKMIRRALPAEGEKGSDRRSLPRYPDSPRWGPARCAPRPPPPARSERSFPGVAHAAARSKIAGAGLRRKLQMIAPACALCAWPM